MYNPSLRKEPRNEPAAVLPITRETSLVDWLEATGRIIPRTPEEPTRIELEEEEVEITDLMDGDDGFIDDDLDDDLDLTDDE